MIVNLTAVQSTENRLTVPIVQTPFGDVAPVGNFVYYDDDSLVQYDNNTNVEYEV